MQDRPDSSSNGGPAAGRLVPAAAAALPRVRDPYGQLGGYPRGPENESGDFRLQVLEYWRIFYKRKWIILSCLAAAVGIGSLRTLMETPLYSSTVRLQIDRNVAKIVEGGNVTPVEGGDSEFLRTQYELLQSRAISERVVSALRLGDDRTFLAPRTFSLPRALKSMLRMGAASDKESSGKSERQAASKAERDRAAAGIVSANRAIRPLPGSRLVDLSYSDPDPARAQRVAMGLAQAFIASNLDKRFEANSYAKTFLEDQLKQLKLLLEDSSNALMAFAEKEQILAVNEKSSIAESNLASANGVLSTLTSERIKNEQLWRQAASAEAINMPQLLTNSVIAGLRDRRNTLVAEYQEKLETFKPGYPAMVQIKNKIVEIDRQLASEVRTIQDSLKAAFENSRNLEAEVTKQIEGLKAEVLDLQKRSIQYNILKREVDTNRSLYEGLLQRYKEVDVASGVGTNNVFIVDRAETPSSPSSPLLGRSLLLAFFFGLGAGLTTAYLLERLDDRINSIEELERITGLATLGIIPKVPNGTTADTQLVDPRSAMAEAYRSLGTALQFSTESGLPKTLVVTSAGPSEGKSTTALAIARHFALMGLKVLVVDADLRKPSLHSIMGLDNSIGLSNYLTGGCTPPEAFQKTDIPNLAAMTSGPLPPNAADLLASSRLFSLLSVGSEAFDFILLDGPPVMGLADAILLTSAASATVFVVSAGQTRTRMVAGALRRLQYAQGTIVGAVLCKFDAASAGYGYGYGDTAYGYGNGKERQLLGTRASG
jgi:polysaccharide biosynthesis transport protein